MADEQRQAGVESGAAFEFLESFRANLYAAVEALLFHASDRSATHLRRRFDRDDRPFLSERVRRADQLLPRATADDQETTARARGSEVRDRDVERESVTRKDPFDFRFVRCGVIELLQ